MNYIFGYFLSIEVLLAAILETKTFVDFVGGCVRGKSIEADGLHAIFLSETDGLANHF